MKTSTAIATATPAAAGVIPASHHAVSTPASHRAGTHADKPTGMTVSNPNRPKRGAASSGNTRRPQKNPVALISSAPLGAQNASAPSTNENESSIAAAAPRFAMKTAIHNGEPAPGI